MSPEALVAINRRKYLWLAAASAFVRRDSLLAIGGWREDLDWFVDWFAVYVIALREGVAYISAPHSLIRERDDSFGRIAMKDPALRDPVIRRFLSVLRQPAFREVRSRFRRGPLMLTYALGNPLFRILCSKPADWDLLWAASSRHILHRAAMILRARRDLPPP